MLKNSSKNITYCLESEEKEMVSDEEILIVYFSGRPQRSGNKVYKISGKRM